MKCTKIWSIAPKQTTKIIQVWQLAAIASCWATWVASPRLSSALCARKTQTAPPQIAFESRSLTKSRLLKETLRTIPKLIRYMNGHVHHILQGSHQPSTLTWEKRWNKGLPKDKPLLRWEHFLHPSQSSQMWDSRKAIFRIKSTQEVTALKKCQKNSRMFSFHKVSKLQTKRYQSS